MKTDKNLIARTYKGSLGQTCLLILNDNKIVYQNSFKFPLTDRDIERIIKRLSPLNFASKPRQKLTSKYTLAYIEQFKKAKATH